MIKRVLKNKLVALGYAATFVENKIREFNISVDTSKYTENDLIQKIKVIVYDKPTAEIPSFFLNVKGDLVEKFLFDGKLNTLSKFSVIGSQISLLDYSVCEKLCIIGITKELDILILMYMPSKETSNRYFGKTYEDLLAEDRENIASDYMEALTGRLSNANAKDIIYVLLTEFVIDTILIENSNPKLKLYDNAYKFAENFTNYEYKYINRRINRIEFVEKYIDIKMSGFGVEIGNISNNPYLLLKEVNNNPNFYLNRPTYVWNRLNSRGQEEIAIFTSIESYSQNTFRELVEEQRGVELEQIAEKLTNQFSNEVGYAISKDYILSVLKKLNKELLILPIDFIRSSTSENFDYIEPLSYRFNVIKDKKEFESMLYNSIDDNLNGRYRYRFVEKLSGIYITVGNKLNYTDLNGKIIRKQSVADFNVNFNAAIIKRETLIDERSIPQLLGFMYKDINTKGTDMLPVPSVEIVFYFPEVNAIGKDVEMYNGTAVDVARGDGFTAFYDIGKVQQNNITKPKNPNEKFITVKYVNSNGEILKENIIKDVMIGTTYIPEIIPIINDREGKEWICEPNQLLSLNVSNDNSKNEIEVRYIKKNAKVVINYINRNGAELRAPIIKNMQVGEIYDMDSAKKYTDQSKVEWNLYQSKPSRFIVSDDESTNILTLVYDVIKADVFVYYQNKKGQELRHSDKFSAVAYKEFSPEIFDKLTSEDGLVWQYAQDSKSKIYVSESELNSVTLLYDELKKRVITKYVDENGKKIKDDLVEIIQVGKEIEARHESIYIDMTARRWKFNKINKTKIKVSENEEDNVFIITYEKVFANVIISMTNENGQRIKDDLIEKAQIGSLYEPVAIKEIEDNSGKYWICVEENKALKIDESEFNNTISYKYKPLITTVYTQYIDVEGNFLLPQKEKQVQAGSVLIPEFINDLQGNDQRSWVLSQNNIKDFKVKKHKEENIIKIHYDKKLIDICLAFKDLQGNSLKKELFVKAHLGSEFKATTYEKITSDNGERWALTRTEPSRLFVKENSKFTLLYDEIKAKVIVKCINISDSKSIIDDVEFISKLGGVYVPNIKSKIVDKQKRRWAYAGEPGLSIIAKENEQENIITLKYEPDKANIKIRYLNKNQQMVHSDVVKAEQIGSEVAIKEFEKVFEEDGLGWKLKNISRKTLVVDEDEEKNIVNCEYEPLIVPVTTRYIDEDINEIAASKIDNIQVGEKFNAIIIPRITDSLGKLWVYSNIKLVELTVKENENNKVNIKYLPLKKKVTEKFLNIENEVLIKDAVSEIQVGDFYSLNKKQRISDSSGKSWIYQKSTNEKIKVNEDESKNIIINYYDKELIPITIKYQTIDGKTLDDDKLLNLQIGSEYTIKPKDIIEDSNKLSWILSKNNELKVKISKEPDKNIFIISYEPYMVNVYDKYINEATNQEIIPPTVTKHQVGSKYLVTVKNDIVDQFGAHWVHAAKSETKIFSSSYKVEPITVIKEEARNITIVKYKPKLADVTIKYQDPLGRQIKTEETKKLQVGTKFNENILLKLVDNLGNKWTYNPHSNSNITISENSEENTVILAYEEEKGTVTFKYLDKIGNELREQTKKLIQIGNIYVPQFDTVITDPNGCVWEYSERNIEKFEVKEDDSENIVELTYIPLNVDVELTMVDLWGNEITQKRIVQAQLGSKFKPNGNNTFTNENSLLYKLVRIDPEFIVVKEKALASKENTNKFKLTYEPINSDIIIIYQDLDGNLLKDEERIHKQVGSKYVPEPIEFIKDKKGNQWQLVNAKTDAITVFENPEQNIIKYVYEVAKADIIIRYINVDGLPIMAETHLSEQVGSEYVPNAKEHIFDKENKKWKLLRVQPVNLKVGSINNIVTIIYQEEKTYVTWKYCDEKGNRLKPNEKHEVQIGARYTPIVRNQVIYDASQIWKLLKIEPYEIIVSENANENIVNLIYTNTKVEVVEEKKEIINPFANTIGADSVERIVEERNAEKKLIEEKLVDEKLVELEPIKINDSKQINQANYYEQSSHQNKEFEFEDEYLKVLARNLALSNSEKIAINELNNINDQIMQEFKKSENAYNQGQNIYDYSKIESLIIKEKEVIKSHFGNLISKDTSGSNLLRIFEHIVASEKYDAIFGKLQQRKAVLLTDYFIEKPIEDMDKIIYIIERGKNNIELELINKKLIDPKIKNKQECIDLKTTLYYEKILLDSYYKARNNSNDNYFKDTTIKETTLPDIVIGVTNLIVKQALNILRKENLNLSLKNELEAIIELCSQQQINSIKIEVDKFDGRQKRNANKLLQEILRK